MSFWWIWGIYFMDHVVLGNDFGMDKKLGAVSGGLGIVRVMAAAWLISVMISAVGMVLASLIFYAVGEGQNRIRVSVYMQAIGSLMNLGMNAILISFSSTAVAVFGVYFKLQSFVFMPVIGSDTDAFCGGWRWELYIMSHSA